MKIAFVVTSLANVGPIVATLRLIRALDKKADIEVFYFKDHNDLVFPVKTQRISFFESINFSDYDIIHSTGLRPDLYLFKNYSKVKNKSVSSVHCYLKEDLGFLHGRLITNLIAPLWYAALKKMNKIVVSTEYMRNYYINELNLNSIVKIPYGIDPLKNIDLSIEELNFLQKLKISYKILGNVSLLIKRKGLEQLILLLNHLKDYAVVIIGDGEERENLMKLVSEHRLQDRFFILGFKENSYKYYKYFDAYVMPSRSEGFSLATLEALSLNLPIISTRLPYYEEFFNDDEICFFELDNPNSLVEAALKAIARKEELVNNARKVFIQNFTIEALGTKHLNLYNYILTENN